MKMKQPETQAVEVEKVVNGMYDRHHATDTQQPVTSVFLAENELKVFLDVS